MHIKWNYTGSLLAVTCKDILHTALCCRYIYSRMLAQRRSRECANVCQL